MMLLEILRDAIPDYYLHKYTTALIQFYLHFYGEKRRTPLLTN